MYLKEVNIIFLIEEPQEITIKYAALHSKFSIIAIWHTNLFPPMFFVLIEKIIFFSQTVIKILHDGL